MQDEDNSVVASLEQANLEDADVDERHRRLLEFVKRLTLEPAETTDAEVVALLNADRLDAGKAPLGLPTALFYQAAAKKAGAFNSIGATGGSNSNQCDSEPSYTCCDRGLLEASGWDSRAFRAA